MRLMHALLFSEQFELFKGLSFRILDALSQLQKIYKLHRTQQVECLHTQECTHKPVFFGFQEFFI